MGSRITRSVFREERARPIDSTRLEDIHQLTVVFLAFIAALASFLHAYLFRIEPGLSFGMVGLFLIVSFFACPKSITCIPILSSLGIFIIIIIGYFIKSPLTFLRSTLILSTLLFATETNSKISQFPLARSVLLWLFYSSFQSGISLSSEMQLTIANLPEGNSNQESMLVKVMFSLIALMGLYLVFMGQRFMKRYQNRSQSQAPSAPRISVSVQALEIVLAALLLFGSFSTQRQLDQAFSWRLLEMAVSGAAIAITLKTNNLDRIYLLVGALSVSIGFLYWVCQGQMHMGTLLKVIDGVLLHICIIDGLRNSYFMVPTKEQANIRLLSAVYFSGFCLSELSGPTNILRDTAPFLPHLIAILSYEALVLLRFKRMRADYVSVI